MTVRSDPTAHIVVISGPSGCGKTALCLRVVGAAREQGLVVRGVLSPARLVQGVKVGIDVLDLSSNERRPLAETEAQAAGSATEGWRFHADALAWGVGILRRSVPCDLLVIDELGPLELLCGAGWAEALATLRSGNYHWALVVVRPELVARFLELTRGGQITIVNVTPDGQEKLLAQMTRLWRDDDAQG